MRLIKRFSIWLKKCDNILCIVSLSSHFNRSFYFLPLFLLLSKTIKLDEKCYKQIHTICLKLIKISSDFKVLFWHFCHWVQIDPLWCVENVPEFFISLLFKLKTYIKSKSESLDRQRKAVLPTIQKENC